MCLSGKTSNLVQHHGCYLVQQHGADSLGSQILIIANLSSSHSYGRACICASFLQFLVCLKGQACKSCQVTGRMWKGTWRNKLQDPLKVTAFCVCVYVCVLSCIQKLSVLVIFLVLSLKWLTYAVPILYNIILLNLCSF